MRIFYTSSTLLSLLALPSVTLGYDIKPFKVNLSSRVAHLKELVKLTKLPETSALGGKAGAGIDLNWLKDRQKDWVGGYDWNKEQAAMNKF
ncbi:epoxide hydrolase amino-terminal protein, partial [Rhizoctonia solani 123E]